MKNLKKHNGITLIALVITIIVMLILVAVTINVTTSGGLFKLAQKSNKRTQRELEREQLIPAVIGKMDTETWKFNGFPDGISTVLKDWKEAEEKDNNFVYISPSGNTFYVSKNGNVTTNGETSGMSEEEKEAWDSDATPEEYFIWASNNPADGELYGTITGYTDNIANLTKIKIPTRCVAIDGNFEYKQTYKYYDFNASGIFSWAYGIKWSATKTINVTSAQIPNTVTKIREAFPYFTKLNSINLPESLIYIGTQTFLGCNNLNKITVEGKDIAKADCNIQYIAGGAFSETPWYSNQPNGEIYIGKVFYKYKGAVPANYTCEIKDGTISIADYAFYNTTTGDSTGNPSSMDGLVGIKVPSSLCFIGEAVFYNRTNLETFEAKSGATLDNITYVGDQSFSSYYYTENENTWATKWYKAQNDGEVYIGKVLYRYKGTMPENYTCNVKEGTRTITSFAFYKATANNLKKLVLPDTVEIIDSSAFYECSNLSELKMSDNIKHIGFSAFYKASSLSSLTFSKNAFKECANDITDSNKKAGTIEANAFKNCTNLKSVTFLGNRPYISTKAFDSNIDI